MGCSGCGQKYKPPASKTPLPVKMRIDLPGPVFMQHQEMPQRGTVITTPKRIRVGPQGPGQPEKVLHEQDKKA